jgi:hypothetical protein
MALDAAAREKQEADTEKISSQHEEVGPPYEYLCEVVMMKGSLGPPWHWSLGLPVSPPDCAGQTAAMPDDKPTTRPPPRRTTTITVYRTETSGWQLTAPPESIAVEADLAQGYHVAETDDGLRIFDQSGTHAMTADEAVLARVLAIPMFVRAARG